MANTVAAQRSEVSVGLPVESIPEIHEMKPRASTRGSCSQIGIMRALLYTDRQARADYLSARPREVSRAAHAGADRGGGSRVRIDPMYLPELEAGVQSAPAERSAFAAAGLSAFVSRVLARCLDIRALWSIGHADLALARPDSAGELLAFADRPTLQMLRKSDHLHRADVELLVVFDGNQFENAWGPHRISGSLARWAWRPVTDELAYYDQSRWADHERDGRVVRVRRKAVLIWRSQ